MCVTFSKRYHPVNVCEMDVIEDGADPPQLFPCLAKPLQKH